jgi:hypothetical protein
MMDLIFYYLQLIFVGLIAVGLGVFLLIWAAMIVEMMLE